MLMPMLVGLRLGRPFLGREMMVHIGVGVASERLMPTSTQLFRNTCSMLVRARPGLKAWPWMTAGVSDSTVSDVQRLQPAAVERD